MVLSLAMVALLILGVSVAQRGLLNRDSGDQHLEQLENFERQSALVLFLAADLNGREPGQADAAGFAGSSRALNAGLQQLEAQTGNLTDAERTGLQTARATYGRLIAGSATSSRLSQQRLSDTLQAFSASVTARVASAIRVQRDSDRVLFNQLVLFSSGVALCLGLMLVLLLVGSRQRTALIQRLSWQVRTDGLTGVLNRRAWDEGIKLLLLRVQRSRQVSSVVMLDLDHFKMFNDTYGHAAGDKLLRVLAQSLQRSTRVTDLVARYGGEEFALALEGCTAEDAQALLERVKSQLPEGRTFSAGVVETTGEVSAAAVLERADRTLYRAKRAGRNRVLIAASTSTRDSGVTVEPQTV